MEQIGSKTGESTSGSLESVLGDDDSADPTTNDWGIDKVAGSNWVLAMYGVICTVGITGNLLVCIVLLRVPSLRSNTSHFLIHLSIVDLLVCILVIPYKIVPPLINSSSPLSQTPQQSPLWDQLACWLYVSQYPFWVFASVSVYTLITVNVERFVAIVYPHRYRRIFGDRWNKLFVIACCWVAAALSKSFILSRYVHDSKDGCRFINWPSRDVQIAIGLCNFVLVLLAPFIFMLTMQWKVISTLKRQVRCLTGRTGSMDMNPANRRRVWQLRTTQSLVRTLVVFAVTFAVCWAPNQIMFLVYNLGGKLNFTSPLYHLSVILAVCNSCINPVVYFVTNRAFRRGVLEAFCARHGSVGPGHHVP